MNFNFTGSFFISKCELKSSIYAFLEKKAEDSQLVRLAGLPVALFSTTVEVGSCVAAIGESAIKGLGNIFGACLQQQGCSFEKGLRQVVYQVPNRTLGAVIFIPLHLVVGGLVKTVGFMVAPKKCAEFFKELNEKEANRLKTIRCNPDEVKSVMDRFNYL